jgi:RNA polymerase sigma-70 factor, ECF subfamily
MHNYFATLMLTNDVRLVRAARNGDQDAFASLVRKHKQPAYLLALKLIHDPEDAREVVQESLLKAYLHLDQFQGDSRFSTWLGRITLNEALMRIRRRPVREEIPLDEGATGTQATPLSAKLRDDTPDPERAFRQAEFRWIIRGAIAKLTPPYRQVFVLRHLEDCSTRETAEILGLTVTAVKTRLRRARVELHRRLHTFYKTGCRESGGMRENDQPGFPRKVKALDKSNCSPSRVRSV